MHFLRQGPVAYQERTAGPCDVLLDYPEDVRSDIETGKEKILFLAVMPLVDIKTDKLEYTFNRLSSRSRVQVKTGSQGWNLSQ